MITLSLQLLDSTQWFKTRFINKKKKNGHRPRFLRNFCTFRKKGFYTRIIFFKVMFFDTLPIKKKNPGVTLTWWMLGKIKIWEIYKWLLIKIASYALPLNAKSFFMWISTGGCAMFGHSCYGGHGKRSFQAPERQPARDWPATSEDETQIDDAINKYFQMKSSSSHFTPFWQKWVCPYTRVRLTTSH